MIRTAPQYNQQTHMNITAQFPDFVQTLQ